MFDGFTQWILEKALDIEYFYSAKHRFGILRAFRGVNNEIQRVKHTVVLVVFYIVGRPHASISSNGGVKGGRPSEKLNALLYPTVFHT